jgi:N-glycosidase YbiA
VTAITSFSGSYRFLSNFWPCEVSMYGRVYPSTEHAFQAAKTLDPADREVIRLARTPGLAKKMGRNVTLRPDWDEFRLQAMRMLLERKFAIPELRAKLLATAPHQLVEGNTWNDTFWGVCDGRGANQLGRMLMAIRADLLSQQQ